MATFTVVGLMDETTGELYVAGVFEGTQKNLDRNVDAEVGGLVLDQFVGYFDADDADDAAELARSVMSQPLSALVLEKAQPAAQDVNVRDGLL